ncbi:MAG: hypothetical protein FJ148_11355 [Deltaproteobacteria bacterium]|nr:hypothetical protein [Deltaproteobacteria bacterium]
MRSTGSRIAWHGPRPRLPIVATVALAASLAASLAAATAARAEIRLPAILGDHMVLQRGRAVLWGTATPGRTIDARIAGAHASGVAAADGAWRIALGDGLVAGGPFELTLGGDGTRVVRDVLIGDVWLAAGQSNMALPVRTASDGGPPASAEDCRGLRFFTVERAASSGPLRDLGGAWRVCTPESAADFSAVAYFFGRDLTATLGVPVGLVVAAWGSTPIEVWRPDPSAATGATAASAPASGVSFSLSVTDLQLVPSDPARAPLPVALEDGGAGLGGAWRAYAKSGSIAGWSALAGAPRGGRFAGEFADPDAWASAATPLRAGKVPIDLSGFGRLAFRARGEGEFRLTLGQASITDGDFFSSEVFVPGPEWASYEVPLEGLKQGGWSVKRPFARDAVTTLGFTISAPPPRARADAFNAMVAPLAPLRLRGVLWYQGEADVARADTYAERLTSLIAGWRASFGVPELPFLVVQLPAYGPGESSWAPLRAAQARAAALPATAVIATLDLGDASDIHPKRKAEVGRRLARAAEVVAYGRRDAAPFVLPSTRADEPAPASEAAPTARTPGASAAPRAPGPPAAPPAS